LNNTPAYRKFPTDFLRQWCSRASQQLGNPRANEIDVERLSLADVEQDRPSQARYGAYLNFEELVRVLALAIEKRHSIFGWFHNKFHF
jgi:hypothetical protein